MKPFNPGTRIVWKSSTSGIECSGTILGLTRKGTRWRVKLDHGKRLEATDEEVLELIEVDAIDPDWLRAVDCPACKGSGRKLLGPYTVHCPRCNGLGRVRRDSIVASSETQATTSATKRQDDVLATLRAPRARPQQVARAAYVRGLLALGWKQRDADTFVSPGGLVVLLGDKGPLVFNEKSRLVSMPLRARKKILLAGQ